ncbi:MAG: lytic transglycosylase domain-containing protein [Acidobacteria bacterium]|nr:lytic transglycosylase domain-containing protein [Acidobacteriota bacterium]
MHWFLAFALGAASVSAQVAPGHIVLAAAAADADNAIGSVPAVAVTPALHSVPELAREAFPPKPNLKDERLNQAEALYEAGYKLYLAGDADGARRQFDAAIDVVLEQSGQANGLAFDRRFDALVQKIHRIEVDSLATGKPFDKAPIDEILTATFPVDPKLKMKVREQVGATVSQLPLQASDAVLSFINYFNGERGKRTLIAGLRRSGKYRGMISRILDEEGIPQEFIFLAQAESGFLPRAVSVAAAGGMWQFIRSRGAEYGLKQDAWVDERFDPELATRAAARHLRDLYHNFGDWYLAIAAYNCGPGNVERAVEKTGYADVWELRSRGTLPLETSNYVPIILAMTIMSKNPVSYGIADVEPEEALLYDTVDITVITSLQLVADILGRPLAEIKDLNPALLRDVAPAGYRMHIPRGAGALLSAGLAKVPAERRLMWRVYRAEAGDTLEALAVRYKATPAAVAAANPHAPETLDAGALVVFPAAPPVVKAKAAKRRPVAVASKKPARKTANVAARKPVARKPRA